MHERLASIMYQLQIHDRHNDTRYGNDLYGITSYRKGKMKNAVTVDVLNKEAKKHFQGKKCERFDSV